jgi:hypothetical protein
MTEAQTLDLPIETIRCKCCSKVVNIEDQFCQACGFPLKGTEENQNTFIYTRGYKHLELQGLERKIKSAGTTLYVLAGFFLLFGLGYFFINAGTNTSSGVLITNAIVAIIFLLLGYWSKKKPVAAIISGMVLFILVQLLSIFEDPSNIYKGIIIKIIIIGYLIKGMKSAFEAERIRKQHNI